MAFATSNRNGLSLPVFGLLLINMVATALDLVLWSRFIKTMKDYSWFVSQLLYPFSITLVLCPVLARQWGSGRLHVDNWRFPKRLFLLLAVCGSVQNLLMTASGQILSGPMQTILIYLGIGPLLLLSSLILGTRYARCHFAGVLGVIVGVVIAVLPKLNGGVEAITAEQLLLALFLNLVMMFVPKTVLEEKYTKSYDMDVIFFRFGEVLLSMFVGVVLIPLSFVQIGDDAAVRPSELGDYLNAALHCFAGESQSSDPSQCKRPWAVWLGFIVANMLHDLTTIAVTKYASAATGALWGSGALVLSNFLFLLPWLSDQPVDGLSPYTFVGLLVMCCGLVLFSWKPEVSPQRRYDLAAEVESVVPPESLFDPVAVASSHGHDVSLQGTVARHGEA